MLSNKSFSLCKNVLFVHYRAFHVNAVLAGKAKREGKNGLQLSGEKTQAGIFCRGACSEKADKY